MNEDILDILDVINNRLITIETKLETRTDHSDEREMIGSLVSSSGDLAGNCRELVGNCRKLTADSNEFRGKIGKLVDSMNKVNSQMDRELKWYREKIDSSLKLGVSNEASFMKEFMTQFSNKWTSITNKLLADFLWLVGIACFLLTMGAFSLGAFITKRINGWYQDTVFEQFYETRFNEELEKPMRKAEIEANEYLKEKKTEADAFLKDQLIQARKQADEEYRNRMEAYARNAVREASKESKKGGQNNEGTETK